MALKWAVVDQFHDYLYGVKFVVRTDSNPLTYVLTTAKLNATGHHWLAALATNDFSLQYKPGCYNMDADALFRYPLEGGSPDGWTEISQSGVKAICQMVISDKNEESSTRLVDQLGADSSIVPPVYACFTQLELGNLKQLTHADLELAQDKDPVIGLVKIAVEQGKVLTTGASAIPRMTLLQRKAGYPE